MAARAVLDEFTAPAEKAALLERSRGRIEGLFGVSLAVLGALGSEEPLPARIWLQLRGAQEAVHSAKVSPAAAPARLPSSARAPRPRPPIGRGPWASPPPPSPASVQRRSEAQGPRAQSPEPAELRSRLASHVTLG